MQLLFKKNILLLQYRDKVLHRQKLFVLSNILLPFVTMNNFIESFLLAKYLQNIVSKVNQNFIPFRNLGYLCFYPFLKFYKTRQEAKNITL